MAYDEDLANRVRELIAGEDGVSEKGMFGGLAFLIGGHMAVSASGQGGLLLRCDPAATDALAAKPHASRAVMRGREMDGWLRIAAEGVGTKRQLERWVARGVAYARSLPPKGGLPALASSARAADLASVAPFNSAAAPARSLPGGQSAATVSARRMRTAGPKRVCAISSTSKTELLVEAARRAGDHLQSRAPRSPARASRRPRPGRVRRRPASVRA